MKNLIVIFVIIMSLSSCMTYKNISKHNELTEATIRAKLIPGKRYEIKLNYGKILKIKVTSVDSTNVYGIENVMNNERKMIKQSFSDSFSNLHNNANSISIKKFNPWLTTAVIVIPMGVLYGIVLNAYYDSLLMYGL